MMRLTRGRTMALAAAMLGAVVAGPALAEEAIVIESDADNIADGVLIPDGGTISIPAGKTVTLITDSGRTVALSGPYEGKVEGGGSGGGETQVVAVLSGLFQRGQEAGQLGATRAVNFPLAANTFELGASGQVCVFDPTKARIAAPVVGSGARVTVMSMTGAASATVDVPTGGGVAWPADLPLKSGAKYLVQKQGETSAKVITIRVMESKAETDLDRVLEMAGAGCDAQALRLLKAIRAEG